MKNIDKICPLCEGKIPKEKIEEFESKFRAQESKIKKQVEVDFNEKLKAEKERSGEKLEQQKELFEDFKKDLKEQQEDYIKRIEKDTKKRFEEQLKDKEKELDSINNKLKNAKSEIEKEIAEKYNDLLKKKQEDIQKLREDSHTEIEKQRLKHEEELRKLEHKTPTELGEEGQAEVLSILRRDFPIDSIKETKIGKSGSDIFHTIYYNGKEIGLIIYEVKNVSNWNNDFIKQAQDDKTRHNANYVFLVSNVLPSKEKTLTKREGILIINAEKVSFIAEEVRNFLIKAYQNKLSEEEVEEKSKVLQEYLNSTEYQDMVDELMRVTKDWTLLRLKEKDVHERHWIEEERLNKVMKEKTAKIHLRIRSIIENIIEKPQIIITQERIKRKKNKINNEG